MSEYETVPGPAEEAEGTVHGSETENVAYDSTSEVSSEETASAEAHKAVDDEVVNDLLQGKYSTDASEQRRRLEAAGYDPEEVKEAVQKRLAQRYQ